MLKIGIFLGGPSSEKEISLESGRHIYNNLNETKYKKISIFVDEKRQFWRVPEALLWLNTCSDIEEHLQDEAEKIVFEDLKKLIDFAFLGLHGKWVEDGCLQGLLEILRVSYNGSGVLASALGMDKYYQRKLLLAAGLDVPEHIAITKEGWKCQMSNVKFQIEKEIGYPCIVKPSREGCSFGLTKVNSKGGLDEAVKGAFRYDNLILVEEFLDGMEVTTTVLGNDEPYALSPTETPCKGDFLTVEEKFLPGEAKMITPARLPKKDIKKIQEDCVKAYKVLGCKVYTRIDGIWKNEKLYILEPNTLPGVTPSTCVFHQAAEGGMSPQQFFDKIIEFSLEAHKKKIGPL